MPRIPVLRQLSRFVYLLSFKLSFFCLPPLILPTLAYKVSMESYEAYSGIDSGGELSAVLEGGGGVHVGCLGGGAEASATEVEGSIGASIEHNHSEI